MVTGKLGINIWKGEVRPLSHTIYKNKFLMYYRLKCKTWNFKTTGENIGERLLAVSLSNDF